MLIMCLPRALGRGVLFPVSLLVGVSYVADYQLYAINDAERPIYRGCTALLTITRFTVGR